MSRLRQLPRRRAAGSLAAVAALFVPAAAAQAQSGHVAWHPGSYAIRGKAPIRIGTIRAPSGATGYVAWIDHERTRLALYPGLYEPPGAAQRGTGAVPSGQRWRLLATFNSGFKAISGAGGFVVNGRVALPLQPGLGTLFVDRAGRMDIAAWHGQAAPRDLVLARQNLSLLVAGGRPSPSVGVGPSWGATLHGAAAVWRTAIGINVKGDLLFAAADGQTAPSLADLMVALGAVRAIELDINPQWPSFNSYRRRGGRDPIKLVPNGQQSAYRWLTPDKRDFFAVYTRAGGGPFVPFR